MNVYYSPAYQNPISSALTVLFSVRYVYVVWLDGSSCVIGSYVCVCVCVNIYIWCDLNRSVQLMDQNANVSFMFKFKLNTGSIVDCDWLDQVGFYGNIRKTET
jgi:hypothetical protein